VEHTRNFWRMFKDSKAVDEHGRPVMVFHGTTNGDIKFEARDKGLYFTSNADMADGYTHGNFFRGGTGERAIYPAYLDMKNPLVIDALGARNDNIPFPGVEWKPKVFGNLPKNSVSVEEAFKRAIAMGHDGLIVRNTADTADPHNKYDRTKGDVYVVAKPEQVKSATGNKGTFDPDNADTAFARGADLFHTDTWSSPEPRKLDKLIYELQDGRIDLKRVQQAIQKVRRSKRSSTRAWPKRCTRAAWCAAPSSSSTPRSSRCCRRWPGPA
jgi:hypothetical protein